MEPSEFDFLLPEKLARSRGFAATGFPRPSLRRRFRTQRRRSIDGEVDNELVSLLEPRGRSCHAISVGMALLLEDTLLSSAKDQCYEFFTLLRKGSQKIKTGFHDEARVYLFLLAPRCARSP
jgi:hypothetical protein